MKQTFWHDPALPFVEARRAQHSRACYRLHSHPTLSIGAVDAGNSTLFVESAEAVRLGAGDVVVIQPHQTHSCNPDPDGEWSYQMLHLDEIWVRHLLSEMRHCAPGLRIDYPTSQRNADWYPAFDRLNTQLFGPLEAEHKESLLIEFVGQLLGGRALLAATVRPHWLSSVLLRLDRQCEATWPVEQLAHEAGISRFHFIRTFQTHVGLTPHAYQLNCRINRARTQLRVGYPLAELAQSLGFSDQSHFHHAFKQRVAVTPRQYLCRDAR